MAMTTDKNSNPVIIIPTGDGPEDESVIIISNIHPMSVPNGGETENVDVIFTAEPYVNDVIQKMSAEHLASYRKMIGGIR